MKKEEFEKYFYKIFDNYLLRSLDNWQIERIKIMVKKSIKKGQQLTPSIVGDNKKE